MLAALSTAHKLGLGLSGLAFIVFALLSAMVIPRSNPDYPGRRLGWFVFVCDPLLRRDDVRRLLLREGSAGAGGRRISDLRALLAPAQKTVSQIGSS